MAARVALPAPTDTTESTTTELATDLSKRGTEEKSHLSIPDDGTPVTIKTRPKANGSKASLLIEYFEGGMGPEEQRKPSVRVRLSQSKGRKDDTIQITKSKSSSSGRKASLHRRSAGSGKTVELEEEDGGSVASATEESNVSRNPPIDIEIGPSHHRRQRRPASPLIPGASAGGMDSSRVSYNPGNASDISAIPTDSFLDGATRSGTDKSATASKGEAFVAGAAAGVATALVADKLRGKSKDKERVKVSSSSSPKDKDRSSSSKHHKSSSSKSRTSSVSMADKQHLDGTRSPRRRSSRGHNESSVVSAASAGAESALSSQLSHSHRSVDTQSVASKSSINNPKLLETVEDAIRRLILPELDALKREQSKRGDHHRRGSVTSSGTSASREDLSYAGEHGRKHSARGSSRARESRGREDRHELAESAMSMGMDPDDDSMSDSELHQHDGRSSTPRVAGGGSSGKHHDGLKAAAAGAAAGGLMAAGAAALNRHHHHEASPSEDRNKRRRAQRLKARGYEGEYDEEELLDDDDERAMLAAGDFSPPKAPMPLMSEINPSEVTRTSILSADTERPHSASEELVTPVHEVRRGMAGGAGSAGSSGSSPTPTRNTPATLQQSLGTQHANISHGDLKQLPRRRTGEYVGGAALGGVAAALAAEALGDEFSRSIPPPPQDEYYDEEEEEEEEEGRDAYGNDGRYDAPPPAGGRDGDNYYLTQDVPAPLNYRPYQQERRGLSPIPSVSGYTEGGSEVQHQRDSRATHTTTDTFSSPEKSPYHGGDEDRGLNSPSSVPSNMRSREFDASDRGSLRSSGMDYLNRNTMYTEDSEVGAGQQVRGVGANPNVVHTPLGVESHVASLVDGSVVDNSVLTTGSAGGYDGEQADYDDEDDGELSELSARRHHSPAKAALAGALAGAAVGAAAMAAAHHIRGKSASPEKRSVGSHDVHMRDAYPDEDEDEEDEEEERQVARNAYTGEYVLNEQGDKVAPPLPYYHPDHQQQQQQQPYKRASPTAAEAAITEAAMRALRAAQQKQHQQAGGAVAPSAPTSLQRNLSFKERARERGPIIAATPTHSVDDLRDGDGYDEGQPKLGASGLPDFNNPEPAYGYIDGDDDDDDVDRQTNPSVVHGRLDGTQRATAAAKDRQASVDDWPENEPTVLPSQLHPPEDAAPHRGLGISDAAGLAAGAMAGGAAAAALATRHSGTTRSSHSRHPSHEQQHHSQRELGTGGGGNGGNEEWNRTSEERKRDTLVTNPYEGASPIAALPGLEAEQLLPPPVMANLGGGGGAGSPGVGVGAGLAGAGAVARGAAFSPVGAGAGLPKDEGYMSEDPNRKGKEVAFDHHRHQQGPARLGDDPFYTPKHVRHLSGLSQGMASPLFDAATGTGIDRIQSKDIIALMQHLSARDAQRTARDTEMIATLVATASDMRTSFLDIKRILADTEDVIITEVNEHTDKGISRISGPRPFPGSAPRSVAGPASLVGTLDDLPAKKRNVLRRALNSLGGGKGSIQDLGRIEQMLMQLLNEVDVLKSQTAPTGASTTGHQSFDNLPGAAQYEQDRGYEPEGNAGTSTASHASQSGGHLSLPQSRNASIKQAAYDRRFSDHRISTVPEANEDEFEPDALPMHEPDAALRYNSDPDLLTPGPQPTRGASVPLDTPPDAAGQALQQQPASLSNDNTPRTAADKGKKHSSRGSASWGPMQKISRWSGTTTSTMAKAFRNSRGKESMQSASAADDYHQGSLQRDDQPPSRSGSGGLDRYQEDFDRAMAAYGSSDKFDDGTAAAAAYSNPDVLAGLMPPQPQYLSSAQQQLRMTPEDPKYKVHRDSLNLQHPQPRSGQAGRFKINLESQAVHMWDNAPAPMSPRSADFSNSATSLHRFPDRQQQQPSQQQQQQQQNRYSDQSASAEAKHHHHHVAEDDDDQYSWSPAAGSSGAPPRPPKEPIVEEQPRAAPLPQQQQVRYAAEPPSPAYARQSYASASNQRRSSGATPPRNSRVSKLAKGSPLPHHSVESGYGTGPGTVATQTLPSYSQHGGSPRPENRNLSGALLSAAAGQGGAAGVGRRPSGPRAMTPTKGRADRHIAADADEQLDPAAEARRKKRDTFGTIASNDSDAF